MLYRKLGKTNEEVSTLGFGCMRLPVLPGNDNSKIIEDEATKLLRRAIDHGVNYIDTAYPYHLGGDNKAGESEPFVGRALKGGYREKVKIATKLPSWLVQSRNDMDDLLNEQLERLQTDYIDFYLVHALNDGLWSGLKNNGISDFLDNALKDGRIRYAGFSFHDKLPVFKRIVDEYDWSFCQIQYNYMDTEFQAGAEGLQYAAGRELGIVIMEPLRGGGLANNVPQEGIDLFNAIAPGSTPAAWAFKWLLDHSEVAVILSGMGNMQQLEENLATFSKPEMTVMSNEEKEAVEKVRKIINAKIKVPCTACEYCMPCPANVNIPGCFAAYNNYALYNSRDAYKFMVQPEEHASVCTECGACVPKCPQGIAIPEKLKEVVSVFGD